MQKITTYLWFEKDAEEAMNFYVSVFNGAPKQAVESRIVSIDRFPDVAVDENMKGLEGKVMNGVFELAGQRLMTLDGGPLFKFNEAISLLIECGSQEEVDYFWGKLSAVPEAEACGWVKDKFGLSWQIVPIEMTKLLASPEREKAERAMKAMLQMKKIDLAEVRRVFNGE